MCPSQNIWTLQLILCKYLPWKLDNPYCHNKDDNTDENGLETMPFEIVERNINKSTKGASTVSLFAPILVIFTY